MKLTEKQKLQIQFNLKPGKCSNCGSNQPPEVLDAQIQLMSPSVQDGIINQDAPIDAWPIIAVKCPECGLISLFDAKFVGADKP